MDNADDTPIRPPLADDDDLSKPQSTSEDTNDYEPTRPSRDRYRSSRSSQGDDNMDELAAIDPKLAERRIKIEELKVRIEERKADHQMVMEMRREDFRQQEFIRDKELLLGSNENWMKTYWRPAAGWIYLIICFMDFVGFPLLSMFAPIASNAFGLRMEYAPWVSITLSQGGLIHLSFGAILGVSAWTRGQEKLAMMNKTSG